MCFCLQFIAINLFEFNLVRCCCCRKSTNEENFRNKLDENVELNEKDDKDKEEDEDTSFELPLLTEETTENENISKSETQKPTFHTVSIDRKNHENDVNVFDDIKEKSIVKDEPDNSLADISKHEEDLNKKETGLKQGKVKPLKNKKKRKGNESTTKVISKHKSEYKKQDNVKKKIDHDIRKAPELTVQVDDVHLPDDINTDNLNSNVEKQRVAIKIKMCFNCDTRHVEELCPLQNAIYIVLDSLNTDKWNVDYKSFYANGKTENDISNYSFAYLSLPNTLKLDNSNTTHGLSVFTNCEIKEFTQFGPLVGSLIKEVDIAEDNSMRDLWEIYCDSGNIYMSTENLETSNWIKFIRPASVREDRNIAAISKENKLYFVTTKLINKGEELLYWQDDMLKTHKKKMEKTSE